MDIITTDERLLEHLKNTFPQYDFTHKLLDLAKEAIKAWEEHDPYRQMELPVFMTCYPLSGSVREKRTGTVHQLCQFLNLWEFLTDEDSLIIMEKDNLYELPNIPKLE